MHVYGKNWQFSSPRSLVIPKLIMPAFGQGKFVHVCGGRQGKRERCTRLNTSMWFWQTKGSVDVIQMFSNIPCTRKPNKTCQGKLVDRTHEKVNLSERKLARLRALGFGLNPEEMIISDYPSRMKTAYAPDIRKHSFNINNTLAKQNNTGARKQIILETSRTLYNPFYYTVFIDNKSGLDYYLRLSLLSCQF